MCARPLNLHRYSSSSDSLCRLPRRLRTLAGDAEALSAAGSATPACEAPPGPPPGPPLDAPVARGRSSRILSIELSSSSLARARRREEHEGQYLRTATRTTISAGQGLHMR